jgi:O-antigen/teichoic acid export membrane protein
VRFRNRDARERLLIEAQQRMSFNRPSVATAAGEATGHTGDVEPPRGSMARDSVLLFAAQLIGNAGLFAGVLILARTLGPDGRGRIAFITVTAMVIARVCKLGLSETTTVLAARMPERRPVLLANLLVWSAAGSLAGGTIVAAALLAFPAARPDGIGTPELGIIVGGAVAYSLWDESILLGCRRMRQLALRIACGGWVSALLLGALALGPGLSVRSAAIAWVVAQALVAITIHRPALRALGRARPSSELLGESLRFGSRAWLGTLSVNLNARLDQVIMGLIASQAALGIYAIAVNASELLLYLPTAVAAALLPRLAGGAGADAGEATVRVFRMALLVTAGSMVAAAAVGPVLVPAIFGAPFRPSVGPFLWLVPGAVGYAAMSIFTNALLAVSSPGRSSLGPLTALLSGIVLDLVLIGRFGATGAAVAATAAFSCGGLAALLLFRGRAPFAWSALLPRGGDVRGLARAGRRLLRERGA